MSQQLINVLIEHLLVPFVIAPFALWIAARYQQWTGRQIEAKHREALQSALENGVRFAIQEVLRQRPQATAADITTTYREVITETAGQYVRDSVPEALRHFGLDRMSDRLRDLVVPKLPLPIGTVLPNGDTLIGRAPQGS
ncbi:hypothetical protein SAMN05216456_1889 [Devosia crocina]|uniref:Bacteriophage holin of superfamily 6 (Holin_LLH) n=1 Tax=Devosia crocina TaxID=429728 RepID=A0A1I7NEM3_9HYPH|nr:hypothetical protein [Devosia crocina]SFV33112.1 hypothetical protein SAMN05216456_1889 [Devosia crocina]